MYTQDMLPGSRPRYWDFDTEADALDFADWAEHESLENRWPCNAQIEQRVHNNEPYWVVTLYR